MKLPIRRDKFDVQGFLAFIADQGGEVGKPSNPYEVVRYRAYWQGSKKPVTHIVYAKENGLLTWMQGTQGHYLAFLAGENIAGNKPPFVSKFDKRESQPATPTRTKGTPPSKGEVTRAKLVERDGTDCWFCGKHMPENDRTIEHLIAKAVGGKNAMANYALAHRKCNNEAADLPLAEKLILRAKMRGIEA